MDNINIIVTVLILLCAIVFIYYVFPFSIKSDKELWGKELEDARVKKDYKQHY